VKKLAECDPEVVVLDVEMPVMNGIEALPAILRQKPNLQVVMASTLTTEGGQVSLSALDLGAADYIAKPSANHLGGAVAYRDELFDKLRRLAEAGRQRSQRASTSPALSALARPAPPAVAHASSAKLPVESAGFEPAVLVVAASTGGPPALKAFFRSLGPNWSTPILIVQHIPATFTAVLAEQLSKAGGPPVVEAKQAMRIEPGVAYLAPGGWHMRLAMEGGRAIVRLDQGPEENFCRPAADPLFTSAANLFGRRVLGVVLTGMGKDGLAGSRSVTAAGGRVLVQDEASSIVWGMPGAVATAGIAHLIAPVAQLAETALAIQKRGR